MARISAGTCLFLIFGLLAGSNASAGVLSHKIDVDPSSVVVKIDQQGKAAVSVSGFRTTNYLEYPELPYTVINMMLPQGEDVSSFRLEGGRRVLIGDPMSIATFKGEYLDDGTTRGLSVKAEQVLGDGSVFPAFEVKHLGTETFRGYNIASFAVYPLHYGMKDGKLTLRTGMVLQVETAPGEDHSVKRLRHVKGFRDESRADVEAMVVNPNMASAYVFNDIVVDPGTRAFTPSYLPSMEGSEVSYLIVTNEEMAPAFQELADWKTKKGVPAVVRTVEWIEQNYRSGVDLGETIRNFIADAYSKWGVEWVLLGGDTDIIPARYGYVAFYSGDFIPTDMYYSCLDGNWNADGDSIWGEAYHTVYDPGDNADLYAEVYLGRMPVSSYSEASILVNKTIKYETPAVPANTSKFLLLGEVIFPTSYNPGDDIILDGAEILEDVYNPYMAGDPDKTVTRLYEVPSLYPGALLLNKESAVDSMSAGYTHVIHAGHGAKYNMAVGSGSILNYDANDLTNGDALFSMYLMNCTNVAFDTDCLAEYFMLNPHGGAFAVTGSSRSAFPSTSRPYLDTYYQLLFRENIVNIGKLYTKSREPYTADAVSETADRWTHFIYNLLGDPEACMYRGAVKQFSVTFPPSVGFGPNDITVQVQSEGAPFDSAYVCLYKDGDDYAHGYTDASGQVVFDDFLCRSDGVIDVTVTGIDHGRYSGTISVSQQSAAFLRVNDHKITDTIVGNNDQVLDSGESVSLWVKLQNTGETGAQKIYAIVRCDDPQVTVTDSTAVYPNIPAGNSQYNIDGFKFSVDPAVEDEKPIDFTIDIHDSTGGFWSEKFAMDVHAPELEIYLTFKSDEEPYGDGSGVIDPGEDILLNIGVKNFGTGAAYGLEGKVRSQSLNFSVLDSVSIYDTIPHMGIEYGDGFVVSEASVVDNNYFTFELTDYFGRVYTRTMELREPAPPDSLWLDASFGAHEMHVTWHPPDHAEAYRYLVYHSLTSGGPYQQGSPDLLFHTMFRDTGLLASTIYYFVVTAVDSCGNQSINSEEAFATTNPPQLEGWPNTINKESASSPKVGDIDGDTHPDVVIGSQYVHAWHGDGVEMRDGDNQPVTWGILNTEGSTFTATIALGQLDGNPGLEMVAASWDTKQIFVFDHDGNTLPGWPKSTVDICWASPILGDFDNDGDLEIVAYDVDGTVYIWHADGTEFMDGDSNPATDGVFFRAGLSSDGWHVSTPAFADMDEDGVPELIVCAPSDYIYCLNNDQSEVPGWPVPVDDGANLSASPAIGDIDGDGHLELVVQNTYARVYGLNNDGTYMTGWPKWIASSTFFNGSPALADLTGDGKLEVVIPGMNGYLYIFRYDGSTLPGWPKQYSTNTATESTPVIADINGDHSLDIILGAENGLLSAWDVNGNNIPGFPIMLNTYLRGTPTVADLDMDGDMELIESSWNQKVYVWDLASQYYYGCSPWNGFHGNIFNNGWVDYRGITDASAIACAWKILHGSLMLNWNVIEGVPSWNLFRSEGDGPYTFVAGDLTADPAGIVTYSDGMVEEGLSYKYKLVADGNESLSSETSLIEVPVVSARLYQNYPNPFNPATRISFTIPGGSDSRQNVLLTVYDVSGALIKTLVNEPMSGGRHTVDWNGVNNRGEAVASGVYFYKFRSGGYSEVKKMILLR